MDHAALFSGAAELLGLPNVDFDPDEAAVLDFGDGVEIGIEASGDGDSFVLYATVAVDAKPDAGLLARLLEANSLYASAGDAVLSYLPASGEVVVRKVAGQGDLEPEGLADVLRDMVDEVDSWRMLLADPGGGAASPATKDEPPPTGAIMGMMA